MPFFKRAGDVDLMGTTSQFQKHKITFMSTWSMTFTPGFRVEMTSNIYLDVIVVSYHPRYPSPERCSYSFRICQPCFGAKAPSPQFPKHSLPQCAFEDSHGQRITQLQPENALARELRWLCGLLSMIHAEAVFQELVLYEIPSSTR